MKSDNLRALVDRGENQNTEFKTGPDPKAVGRVVCSFLNSGGGTLLCGVDGSGKVLGIRGNAPVAARNLEMLLKKAISPTPFFTTVVADLDDVPLIVIDVPDGLDGPYVFDGGIWLREKESSFQADWAALRDMFARSAREPERWERRLSPSMSEADLDLDEVGTSVTEAAEAGRLAFTDAEDLNAVLSQLAAMTPGGYTQGGDVLFSKLPSLRHPQVRAQLGVFGDSRADQEYQDYRWFEGPLVRVCSQIYAAVEAAIPNRVIFSSTDGRRRELRAFDPTVLREGIVNAFVHRDYSAYTGGLKVSMFPDRVEIWNSGRLPDGLRPNDLRRAHSSILINPDIAQVFYLRGLMEKIGRGTQYIANMSRETGAVAPQWKNTNGGVMLTIFAATRTANRDDFNFRQRRLLEELRLDDRLSMREYVDAYVKGEVTDRQARRDLEELVRAGYLRIEGAGPGTRYRRRR